MEIDFVIPWVDGNDLKWIEEKNKYSPMTNSDIRKNRFRDWDNLQYWFRGVEKYTPWVRKIFFITWGHLPEWLDPTNPKIQIVNHKDYIPQEFLPTFNTNTIELNLHRIEGLADRFVYFNDDTFIINHMQEKDFFRGGLPRDMAALESFSATDVFSFMVYNNMFIINKHFQKHEAIKQNFFKWFNLKYGKELYKTIVLYPWSTFSGLVSPHLPIAYEKKTYEEVWRQESEILNNTCLNKFRNKSDVTGWLFRYWRLVRGDFFPDNVSFGKYFEVNSAKDAKNIASLICKQNYSMVCINDSDKIADDQFSLIKKTIKDGFEEILPKKSSFEY